MTQLKQLTSIILISILIPACGSDIKDITPKFKSGLEHISKELSSEIQFSQLGIHTTKSESTGERTSRNLDIVLTDASIKMFTQEGA